jgi:SAM-dependent methyltransferase
MDDASGALVELGRALQDEGYEFVTVTPETHRRVNERAQALGRGLARNLRGVFGWNRPFESELLPAAQLDLLRAADALESEGELFRSRVRFSTLRGRLFVHSAYPTLANGTGAGAISIAERVERRLLADISPLALCFARVNAKLSEVRVDVVHSDTLEAVPEVDMVIANPPYMRDAAGRLYRDGGGAYGEGLAVRIVSEVLDRMRHGGTLVLYTGAAFVDGRDTVLTAVAPLLRSRKLSFNYEELDPDVFGDELIQPAYGEVERIAAVGLQVTVR